MELNYIVCAQSAVIDQTTRNVSIHNILEQIGSVAFPFAVPMTIVAHITRKKNEKEKQNLRIIVTIDGHKLPGKAGDLPATIDFQGQLGTRFLAQVQAFVIPRPGLLAVSLQARNRILGTWSIRINKVGEEALLSSIPSTQSSEKKQSRKGKSRRKTKRS